MDTILQAKLMIFAALKHSDLTGVYCNKVGNAFFLMFMGPFIVIMF
jgi:hypothetical protein